MSKLGLGLIGCGWAARNLHMASYRDLFELKAICCRTEDHAEKFKDEFGFERAYTGYIDLLESPDVDVVTICTPASTRLEIIEPAAKLGKHIFTEKPLAWEIEEAQRSVEACEKYRVKLAVADQYRFFPHIQAAAKIIENGLLGTPFAGLLESMIFFDYPAYPGQKRGFVIEQITHNIDALRCILGEEAVDVYAKMGRSPSKVRRGETREFWDTITITFESDCVIQLFNSWDCWGYNVDEESPEGRMHLECDRGTLFLNKDESTPLTAYSADLGGWFTPDVTPKLRRDQLEAYGTGESMKRFIECIERGGEHPVSGREYLKTLRIAFAAYESAGKNMPIKV